MPRSYLNKKLICIQERLASLLVRSIVCFFVKTLRWRKLTPAVPRQNLLIFGPRRCTIYATFGIRLYHCVACSYASAS